MSKRVNNKFYILFFGLSCCLSFLPLYGSADTEVILPELIYDSSEHFSDIESANLDGLLERIGDSRVVLLGEASHGTAEFYDMRARITRELIEKKGFTIVAVEADWPDAQIIDDHIRNTTPADNERTADWKTNTKRPFTGFPGWMWANHSILEFIHWLKAHNGKIDSPEEQIQPQVIKTKYCA